MNNKEILANPAFTGQTSKFNVETIFIADLGSFAVRFGPAMSNALKAGIPAVTFVNKDEHPTSLSRFCFGEDSVTNQYEYSHVEPIFPDGMIENWDIFHRLMVYLFKLQNFRPEEGQLAIIEPASFSRDPGKRRELAEFLFESFSVASIYISDAATMAAAVRQGKSCIVIDSGNHHTTLTPVNEHGVPLMNWQRRLPYGGFYLTKRLAEDVADWEQLDVIPTSALGLSAFKTWNEVFTSYPDAQENLMSHITYRKWQDVNTMKTELASVYPIELNPEEVERERRLHMSDSSASSSQNKKQFAEELFVQRDGDRVTWRFRDTAKEIIDGLADELRPRAVVVNGGNSLVKGYCQRVNNELKTICQEPFELVFCQSQYRMWTPWVGAARLAAKELLNFTSVGEFRETGRI